MPGLLRFSKRRFPRAGLFHLLSGLLKKGGGLTEDELHALRGFVTSTVASAAFVRRLATEHGAESIAETFLLRDDPPELALEFLLPRHPFRAWRLFRWLTQGVALGIRFALGCFISGLPPSSDFGATNPTGTEHFPDGAAEGRNAAVVFMDGPAKGEAGLQQTLAATLRRATASQRRLIRLRPEATSG